MALYVKKYHAQLDALEPWQRVEAIRHALFSTALKHVNHSGGTYEDFFGNGILQANDALGVPVNPNLAKTPEDRVPWFPILNTVFKSIPNPQERKRNAMFNTELAQLVFYHKELASVIGNDEQEFSGVSTAQWNAFREAVVDHPAASEPQRCLFVLILVRVSGASGPWF